MSSAKDFGQRSWPPMQAGPARHRPVDGSAPATGYGAADAAGHDDASHGYGGFDPQLPGASGAPGFGRPSHATPPAPPRFPADAGQPRHQPTAHGAAHGYEQPAQWPAPPPASGGFPAQTPGQTTAGRTAGGSPGYAAEPHDPLRGSFPAAGAGRFQQDPYAPQFTDYAQPATQPPAYRLDQHHGDAPFAAPSQASALAQGRPSHEAQPRMHGAHDGFAGYDADPAAAYRPPNPVQPEFGGNTWSGNHAAQPHDMGYPGEAGQQGYDAYAYRQGPEGYAEQGADYGFAEPAGGELDANYAEDDYEYEVEPEPRRGGFAKIAAALVGAIVIGGGLAYGYRTVVGDSGSGEPPLVRSASAPEKVKPADAGGKQFAHSDSKIMSRLGESTSSSSASGLDSSGTRKVSTMVIGRDGTIQNPPTAPQAGSTVSVPGLTVVDAFPSSGAAAPARLPAPVPPAPATPSAPKVVNAAPSSEKVVVEPPQKRTPPSTTASLSDASTPAAQPARPTQVAAAAPTAAAAKPAPKPATNGYVAVLASLPRSSTSRVAALARFADMQQKYASVLAGKTPDVAAANLGAKGNYHRLVVGPPGSRQQASSLCSALKQEGYNDCWITAY